VKTADALHSLVRLLWQENAFHRRRLEAAGASPDASLEELPFLTKGELVDDQRAHPPFGTNLTYGLDRYTHLHQTSGTIGPPLYVLDTAEDWLLWRLGFARVLHAAGVTPGDRVALAFSFGPHVQFFAARAGLEEIGAIGVPLGGMTSLQRLLTIADVRATALMCTPSYALRLSEVAIEEDLEQALATVRRVICMGEPGGSLSSVRARIESAFGAQCCDHAGLSEVGPFAYPCAEAGGLHVDGERYVCEIVDADLRPVPAGERGELVLTPLLRTGYPVLRYRTGDIALNEPERCPAGHADRWLPGGIIGRTDDMVVVRGMNVYPSALEEAVRQIAGSGEFRITFYTEDRALDQVKLEVELSDATHAGRLQEMIRQRVGLRVRIIPVALGTLPRNDGGKTRRVVDQRERR
jgi:phenylacetate-CoA ligase